MHASSELNYSDYTTARSAESQCSTQVKIYIPVTSDKGPLIPPQAA